MTKTKKPDSELAAFEAALLQSVDQMQRGEFAATTTPEQAAAKKRGRSVGYRKPGAKVPTTIRFSPDVLDAFKDSGDGWQTRMDSALRDWLTTHTPEQAGA